MHLCLFEDEAVSGLRPLTETRPAYALRLGMRSILATARDAFTPDALTLHTRPPVAAVTVQTFPEVPVNRLPDDDVLFVNGRFVAHADAAVTPIRKHAESGGDARVFLHDDTVVAAWVPNAEAHFPEDLLAEGPLSAELFSNLPATSLDTARLVHRPWHLLDGLADTLERDAAAHTTPPDTPSLPDRDHASVHDSVATVHPEAVHLGTAATVKPGAVLNAENGPIVLGNDAVIHEQAVLKGPCYVGPKSHIKGGADIETAAFGYWCKVGGEVHDTVIHSLSNKAHPGFLGDAYLGRWCNLGADTNTSNLKNDYSDVSAYAPDEDAFVDTGRQFAGLFMGDHSKCGINTMFNTGTVVGTFCNLYGGDFPPRYVPPFSWGGPDTGFTTYRLQKALAVAERVMARRDTDLTDADRALLSGLYDRTADERDTHHD
jgi:UDP-N-acetylglucosamine diphosphorylase/glucosamine-1-phosphate N-acetyltransferase